MQINMLGSNWKHTADFAKERPDGIHGMQLIVVRSKARICMGEREYRVGSNTAFIIESCFPHSIYADGEEYNDDFIRFDIEDDDSDFLDSLGIEYNVPIVLDSDAVSKLIAVCAEIYAADKPEKNESLKHIMRAIFTEIKSCFDPTVRSRHTHYDIEMDSIRRQIYDSPADDWNIPQIAEQLSMSVSHFQRLYKLRFGIPCTKDILTGRMELAKQLLSGSDKTVSEIAEECGFTDYAHFSRVFKKYACVSPANYRKNKEQD